MKTEIQILIEKYSNIICAMNEAEKTITSNKPDYTNSKNIYEYVIKDLENSIIKDKEELVNNLKDIKPTKQINIIEKKPNWEFERSSGYAGYRCQECFTWVHYNRTSDGCDCNK